LWVARSASGKLNRGSNHPKTLCNIYCIHDLAPEDEPERVGPCSNLEKVNQILYQANPKMGAIVGVHLSN
jgi:hypothetical protein